MLVSPQSIVVFDGECGFCSESVKFVKVHDKKCKFCFVPLQSVQAIDLLKKFKLSSDLTDTVVLVEKGCIYTKSTAVLRIVRQLPGLWPLLAVFLALPVTLRDFFYDAFAVRRYCWSDKSRSCLVSQSTDHRPYPK